MEFPAVVDYSYGRPGGRAIVEAGYAGAMRYLGEDGRCITAGEVAELLGWGLGIGLIWETTAHRPLDGFAAGVDDADRANAYADALGAPPGIDVFYAVDFQPTGGDLDVISAYFAGVDSVPGRPVGVYGCASVMQRIVGDDHLAEVGWQCAAWSYPGSAPGTPITDGGWNLVLSPHASMLQCIGYVLSDTSDHNNLLTVPSWLWGYEGADMPLSQDDLNAITVIVGGVIDNRIQEFSTPARVFSGSGGQYEVVLVDGCRYRRAFKSPAEVQALQMCNVVARQPVIEVGKLTADQQAALEALPWVDQ